MPDPVPVTAFRREIMINASRQAVWDHFKRVTNWHTWLPEVTAVDIKPGPELGPDSIVTLHMPVGLTFQMVEFDAPNHWMWTTQVRGMTLLYDHIFEAITDQQTRLVLDLKVSGSGGEQFAPMLAATSKSTHANGLPILKREIEESR